MTRTITAEMADHRRDHLKHEWRPGDAPPWDQRILRVAYLTAYLDTLLRIGVIPSELRGGIRSSVDSTRKAFDLPDLGPTEREDA